MKKVLFLALALAGFGAAGAVSLAPQAAQAQGYFDGNNDRYNQDDGYDQGYRDGRSDARNYYKRKRKSDSCKALIRASGVGNIVPGIARINAIKAWQRETRAVYGRSFNWRAAKANSVICEPYGISTRCTAKARPCV